MCWDCDGYFDNAALPHHLLVLQPHGVILADGLVGMWDGQRDQLRGVLGLEAKRWPRCRS